MVEAEFPEVQVVNVESTEAETESIESPEVQVPIAPAGRVAPPVFPEDDVKVVRVGGGRFALPLHLGETAIHPFKVVARLADGRRFELRVPAINRQEAVRQVSEKFPAAQVVSVRRADIIKTAKKIARAIDRIL